MRYLIYIDTQFYCEFNGSREGLYKFVERLQLARDEQCYAMYLENGHAVQLKLTDAGRVGNEGM